MAQNPAELFLLIKLQQSYDRFLAGQNCLVEVKNRIERVIYTEKITNKSTTSFFLYKKKFCKKM